MKTKTLVRSILLTAASLAITTSAFGDASEAAVKAAAPNATAKLIHSETVNNIKLETYGVTEGKTPEWYTTYTENGDLMASASPHTAAEMPPAVAEVTSTLFGAAPSKIYAMEITDYVVAVKTANQVYALTINAAGVLTSIDATQQMAFEDPHQAPKADAATVAGIDKLVEQHVPGAVIASINQSKSAPGFYAVEFTLKGQPGWIVLNKENRVRAWSNQITEAETPKPVLAAAAAIKGATVQVVNKHVYRCWDMTEPTATGNVEVRVRPDGSVIQIESDLTKAAKAASPVKAAK